MRWTFGVELERPLVKRPEVVGWWDERVASEPDSPHFSLVLVFNLRAQFEQLREAGRCEKLRSSILPRDEALAGSVNPMLAWHGGVSEARRYNGRMVDEEWCCPFQPRAADAGAGDML
jgi:FPC/CPF motif-containing protein YcgG